MIPLPAYYKTSLIQSTLPFAVSGSKQKVSLVSDLPAALIDLINKSDIFALIGCSDQRGEIVRILKNSYNQTTRSLDLLRGQSKYANQAIDTQSVIDLTAVPRNIFLDFGVIHPQSLQELSDLTSGLLGYDSQILRNLLPPATQTQIGGLKAAYITPDETSTFVPSVLPTNAPAHERLYKSIYGPNSVNYQTGQVNETELARIKVVGDLVDWLSDNPNRLLTLIKLIDVLNSDPAKLTKIIS